MLRRQRVATEERELLPLHRASPSIASPSPFSPKFSVRSPDLRSPDPTTSTIHPSTSAPPPPPPRRKETPHDAALAELNHRLSGKPPVPPPKGSASGAGTVVGEPATSTSTSSNSKKKRRHYSLHAIPDRIYDPCTGAFRGTLCEASSDSQATSSSPTPISSSASSSSSSSSDSDVSASASSYFRDQKHLAIERLAALNRIRDIQSQVARTQHAMESIGSTSSPRQAGGGGASSSATELGGAGRRGGGVGGASATNASTSTLSPKGRPLAPLRSNTEPPADDTTTTTAAPSGFNDHFAERRSAIDKIVQHLEDLSKAVQDFHQIPTPDFDFPPIQPPRRASSRSRSPVQQHAPSRYPSTSTSTSTSTSRRLTSLNRARSLSPAPPPPPHLQLHIPSKAQQGPMSTSMIAARQTTTATLPVILDRHDDYHRLHHESPTSTQASFRLYD